MNPPWLKLSGLFIMSGYADKHCIFEGREMHLQEKLWSKYTGCSSINVVNPRSSQCCSTLGDLCALGPHSSSVYRVCLHRSCLLPTFSHIPSLFRKASSHCQPASKYHSHLEATFLSDVALCGQHPFLDAVGEFLLHTPTSFSHPGVGGGLCVCVCAETVSALSQRSLMALCWW